MSKTYNVTVTTTLTVVVSDEAAALYALDIERLKARGEALSPLGRAMQHQAPHDQIKTAIKSNLREEGKALMRELAEDWADSGVRMRFAPTDVTIEDKINAA